MGFQLAPFSPMIGVVVVIHVAQQQAGFGFVHDQSNVEADANRPEPWIFRLVELVELQSRMGRVYLEIEGRVFTAFCASPVSLARVCPGRFYRFSITLRS